MAPSLHNFITAQTQRNIAAFSASLVDFTTKKAQLLLIINLINSQRQKKSFYFKSLIVLRIITTLFCSKYNAQITQANLYTVSHKGKNMKKS